MRRLEITKKALIVKADFSTAQWQMLYHTLRYHTLSNPVLTVILQNRRQLCSCYSLRIGGRSSFSYWQRKEPGLLTLRKNKSGRFSPSIQSSAEKTILFWKTKDWPKSGLCSSFISDQITYSINPFQAREKGVLDGTVDNKPFTSRDWSLNPILGHKITVCSCPYVSTSQNHYTVY